MRPTAVGTRFERSERSRRDRSTMVFLMRKLARFTCYAEASRSARAAMQNFSSLGSMMLRARRESTLAGGPKKSGNTYWDSLHKLGKSSKSERLKQALERPGTDWGASLSQPGSRGRWRLVRSAACPLTLGGGWNQAAH